MHGSCIVKRIEGLLGLVTNSPAEPLLDSVDEAGTAETGIVFAARAPSAKQVVFVRAFDFCSMAHHGLSLEDCAMLALYVACMHVNPADIAWDDQTVSRLLQNASPECVFPRSRERSWRSLTASRRYGSARQAVWQCSAGFGSSSRPRWFSCLPLASRQQQHAFAPDAARLHRLGCFGAFKLARWWALADNDLSRLVVVHYNALLFCNCCRKPSLKGRVCIPSFRHLDRGEREEHRR